MRKLLVILALLVISASDLRANNYAVGYVADGYTWNGSYWVWSDGSLWTRTWVPGYTYYSNGCYHATAGYWSYKYYGVGKPYTATTTYSTPRTGTIIIAEAVAARDKVRSEILSRAHDYESFLRAMHEAKLDQDLGPIPALSGYGVSGGYGYGPLVPNSLLSGSYGYNAQSIYGWAQSPVYQVQQLGNPLDPNQAILQLAQSGQLVNAANRDVQLAFQSGIAPLVGQQLLSNSEAARAAATVEILKAITVPQLNTASGTLRLDNGQIGPLRERLPAPRAQSAVGGTLEERWTAAATKCAACHYKEKIEGNFDISKFPSMSFEQHLAVRDRLHLPKTDAKFMPKGGEPLSADDLRVWDEYILELRRQSKK